MKIKKSEDSKRKCISDIMYIINLIQELERYSSFRVIRKRKLSKEIDEEYLLTNALKVKCFMAYYQTLIVIALIINSEQQYTMSTLSI